MEALAVLQEAGKIVQGARQADYGPPERNFENIAKIWSVIMGIEVSPAKVALCMCGLKIAREVNQPKRDNMVDLAGYAALAHELTLPPTTIEVLPKP